MANPRTAKPDGVERLHVRIAKSGLCSRRAAEKLIAEGRVEVNGELVVEMGQKVGPDDKVHVDGRPIHTAKLYTVLLNKPAGVVTTLSDPQRRPTIEQFLPDYGVQLKPVGRLDMETEGLLICSNDGELALRLTHPRFGVEKEYLATVEGIPNEKALADLRKGVWIEGGRTAPARAEIVHAESSGKTSVVLLVIHEGRKRQIRHMMLAVGHPVQKLKRTRIGHLKLKGLRSGECVLLGKADLELLRKQVGLKSEG